MPWLTTNLMDERVKFIAAYLHGGVAELHGDVAVHPFVSAVVRRRPPARAKVLDAETQPPGRWAGQAVATRGRDQDGHVDPDETPRHGQGRHERGRAEHAQDVEDVAPHRVAESEVALAAQGRPKAHRKLRGARAPGHHGEADDEGRDPELRGDCRGAEHEGVSPEHEQDEAGEEEEKREEHVTSAGRLRRRRARP
jgi:hypothetical protein